MAGTKAWQRPKKRGGELWISALTEKLLSSPEAVGAWAVIPRWPWPEPIGALVAYLASSQAELMTGACINIDGGQSKSLT